VIAVLAAPFFAFFTLNQLYASATPTLRSALESTPILSDYVATGPDQNGRPLLVFVAMVVLVLVGFVSIMVVRHRVMRRLRRPPSSNRATLLLGLFVLTVCAVLALVFGLMLAGFSAGIASGGDLDREIPDSPSGFAIAFTMVGLVIVAVPFYLRSARRSATRAAEQELDTERGIGYVSTTVGDEITAPSGWYEAPDGDGRQYWDGTRWTEHRSP
jgi:hypothetical protein